MSDDKLNEFESDFGLFVEAGFIAVKQMDERSAVNLFEAARLLKEDSPAPIVGLGFVALNKLEVKQAEEHFKKALEMDSDHHLARAFLGITYLLSEPKRAEGEKLLAEAMEKSDDSTVSDLVKVSLEWATKDLKKQKAPFFASKQEEG